MEEWRDIKGFLGYQISNKGNVRSFWKKKHYPTGYGTYRSLSDEPIIMSQSDDGNGYRKVMLYNHETGKRQCKKIHRLVADAFISNNDPTKDTVDHIRSGPEGKLDNSVKNLRWISRRENIQKAYSDGMCDERILDQCKDIIAFDTWTGNEIYFSSIKEASTELSINYSTIVHSIRKSSIVQRRYIFEYADNEGRLLYGDDDNKFISWLQAGIR